MTPDVEERIRSRLAAGDLEEAAALGLRSYGREILGLLVAFHRDEHEAGEVFSDFTEELWKALPAFRLEASFRTWAYVLARRASWRYRHAQRARPAPSPLSMEISRIAADVRSETVTYLRAES